MQISREHLTGYNLIKLRVIVQMAIEIMDDLDFVEYPLRNKSLQSQFVAMYPALDKETKKYNSMYQASAEGTSHFYDVVKRNTELVMRPHLIDNYRLNRYLEADDYDTKAVEGIIKKVLKAKREKQCR